jgi:hypothetical protein
MQINTVQFREKKRFCSCNFLIWIVRLWWYPRVVWRWCRVKDAWWVHSLVLYRGGRILWLTLVLTGYHDNSWRKKNGTFYIKWIFLKDFFIKINSLLIKGTLPQCISSNAGMFNYRKSNAESVQRYCQNEQRK